jgi:putative ABC transport system permease protein
MTILWLAWKSLWSRRLTTGLTVMSIALSVALLIGVDIAQAGARDSFSGSISKTDLVVGARGGSLQLLLYAVFRMGSSNNDISYESYEHFAHHPAVQWAIPLSLGDNHRGFRVVGTDANFYEHYRYRGNRSVQISQGRQPSGIFDAALGSEVAERLHYHLGQKIILAHGLSAISFIKHDDRPFTIVGILAKTGTPVDRSIYITLYGVEAMHVGWSDGAPPMPGDEIPASQIRAQDLKIDQISAFLLGTKSRIDTLLLQREINTYKPESLTAIVPGLALADLWNTFDYADKALSLVSAFVLFVGLLGMLVSLYTLLNERRREIAVLRAIGLGAKQVFALLVLESCLLSACGVVLGTALIYAVLALLQGTIERHFGLYLPIEPLSTRAYTYMVLVVCCGTLIGVVPALKAYQNSLVDGLNVHT